MIYEVVYDKVCEKQLTKLPKEIRQRIFQKMREVSLTGRGIESIKEAEFGYKVRIGNYRALIDLESQKITVRYIDHRKRIYKR